MVNPIFIWCNLFLITLSNPGSASLSSPSRLVPGPISTIQISRGGLEPTSVMWRAWWRHTHPSLPRTNGNEVDLDHHLVSRTRDVELTPSSFCLSQHIVQFIVTLSLYLLMILLTFFNRFKVHYKSSCVCCSTDKDCDYMSYPDSSCFCLSFCDKANILFRYRPF